MKRAILTLSLIAVFAFPRVSAQGCGGAPSDEGLKMFGFLQSQYEHHFAETDKNSFTFERARIGAMGKIPYDFSYYVVAELSPFISANPYLLDAFITYDRFSMAKLSVGSFKTPFGLETNTACNGLMTVYRSTATLQMVAPFRDMGAMLLG
ncbi:MAG TPA: porin, partial [Lentimicrobium sp.]|nr:porin [Lentimicrobium sp.]